MKRLAASAGDGYGDEMLEADQNAIESGSISRRAVLCGALALTMGLAPDISSASVPASGISQSGGKLKIDLAKNKALAKVGGIVTIPLSDGRTIAIIRTTKAVSGYVSVDLSCTHNGVTVMQQGNTWLCPAHGSEFTLPGKVVRGPARTALTKIPLTATAKVITLG